jgi:hypothetical protein
VLGTCLDGFIFGACCKIQEGVTLGPAEENQIANSQEEDPMGILKKIDQLLKSFNRSGYLPQKIKARESGLEIMIICN